MNGANGTRAGARRPWATARGGGTLDPTTSRPVVARPGIQSPPAAIRSERTRRTAARRRPRAPPQRRAGILVFDAMIPESRDTRSASPRALHLRTRARSDGPPPVGCSRPRSQRRAPSPTPDDARERRRCGARQLRDLARSARTCVADAPRPRSTTRPRRDTFPYDQPPMATRRVALRCDRRSPVDCSSAIVLMCLLEPPGRLALVGKRVLDIVEWARLRRPARRATRRAGRRCWRGLWRESLVFRVDRPHRFMRAFASNRGLFRGRFGAIERGRDAPVRGAGGSGSTGRTEFHQRTPRGDPKVLQPSRIPRHHDGRDACSAT